VGAHRAESLTGRCEPVDAREAVRIGLVDEHAFVTKRPSSSTRDAGVQVVVHGQYTPRVTGRRAISSLG
jgi:hypothetical protein